MMMNTLRNISIVLFLVLSICSCDESTTSTRINLAGQSLYRVPASVFQNGAATYLNLGAAESRNIYPPVSSIGDSDSLAYSTDSLNYISYLPEDIGELQHLKTLILSYNKLITLPESISNLKQLEHLDLSYNEDFQVVEELSKIRALPNLKSLSLTGIKGLENDIEHIRKTLPGVKVIYENSEVAMNNANSH